MLMTDIHCPECGHHLFKADLGPMTEGTRTPMQRMTAGTEVAAALLEDFFSEQSGVVRVASGRVLQSELIAAFNAWANARGSTPQSSSAIGRGLRELGIEPARSNGQRYYRGVAFVHETQLTGC